MISTLSVTNKPLSSQRERIAASALARAEMETVTAELEISQALRSKLPPATKCRHEPGEKSEFIRKRKKWCDPVTVTRVAGKEVTNYRRPTI